MNITKAEWAALERAGRFRRVVLKSKRSTLRSCPTEDQEQIALINWARLQYRTYPQLMMLFHAPNGGSRHVLEAVKLKKMGVLPSVPDLILLYPNNGFHGWLGEMKAIDGKPTPSQRQMRKNLRALGYDAEIYYGWESARDGLVKYLRRT